MAQQVSTIQDKIKNIVKKDTASVTLAISALSSKKQGTLLQLLTSVESSTLKKSKREMDDEKSENRAEDEGRFLGRLKAKLFNIENELVRIRTRFYNAKELLTEEIPEDTSEKELLAKFRSLTTFVADLDILKCLARVKQGDVVTRLRERGMATRQIASKLEIPSGFVERLLTFYKLAKRFPMLCLSGYSMETLLKFKKAIVRAAAEDDNFCARLELAVEYQFEGEDDEGLIDEGLIDAAEAAEAAAEAAAALEEPEGADVADAIDAAQAAAAFGEEPEGEDVADAAIESAEAVMRRRDP